MELHNWNYMSSIDNYGTPYSSLFFCPFGTPYVLNKRTGLILAECISFNLYDMQLFVWAKYRIMRPWLFIKSLNVTVCWCIICLKALSTNDFVCCFCDYTQRWQAAMPMHWSPLLLYSETTWAVGIAQLTHHEVQGGGKNPETGGRGIFYPTADRVVS